MNSEKINSYDFQSIIALNDHLITKTSITEIFEYISFYLKKDFLIDKFSLTFKDKLIYKNFEMKKDLEQKFFLIDLAASDKLKVSIFYENKDSRNIEDCFDLVKSIFKIISQTVYNKYLRLKLKEMTLKDSLTGLYNRQYVGEYLKTTLPLVDRENKKVAFLKIGIDHFKAVIDEFDYEVGDKVLKELANTLKEVLRKSDVIARIESDEFFIVLNNISNENNAIIVADKIINNFKEIKVIVDEETNQTLMKTVCTGISIYPDDASNLEDIFKFSDIALYEARNNGRSQLFKYKKEAATIELF